MRDESQEVLGAVVQAQQCREAGRARGALLHRHLELVVQDPGGDGTHERAHHEQADIGAAQRGAEVLVDDGVDGRAAFVARNASGDHDRYDEVQDGDRDQQVGGEQHARDEGGRNSRGQTAGDAARADQAEEPPRLARIDLLVREAPELREQEQPVGTGPEIEGDRGGTAAEAEPGAEAEQRDPGDHRDPGQPLPRGGPAGQPSRPRRDQQHERRQRDGDVGQASRGQMAEQEPVARDARERVGEDDEEVERAERDDEPPLAFADLDDGHALSRPLRTSVPRRVRPGDARPSGLHGVCRAPSCGWPRRCARRAREDDDVSRADARSRKRRETRARDLSDLERSRDLACALHCGRP